MTISGELEILTEKTEKSGKIQEVNIVPNATKNIVSVELLLKNGDEIGIINFRYKGTIMKLIK